jgi:hypothetical protein
VRGCTEGVSLGDHNAVRSAQLGEDTVPEGFHPIANGGVIHERRHALTWAISPGVSWEKTEQNQGLRASTTPRRGVER